MIKGISTDKGNELLLVQDDNGMLVKKVAGTDPEFIKLATTADGRAARMYPTADALRATQNVIAMQRTEEHGIRAYWTEVGGVRVAIDPEPVQPAGTEQKEGMAGRTERAAEVLPADVPATPEAGAGTVVPPITGDVKEGG